MDTEILSNCKFIKRNYTLKPEHVDYLKKINPDNESDSIRILIDSHIKMSRALRWERVMMYFVFVMCLVILVILLYPVLVM